MSQTHSEQTPPRHRLLRAVLRVPVVVAVTIYFLIDDVVLAAMRPLVAWGAELRPFVRLAAAIARLPAAATLVLFLVPFAVLEPVKLWALWLIADGRAVGGATTLATAHLLSIVVVERLFHATRDKLLTIGWFATVHRWVMRLYDWSVGRLRTTTTWRRAAAALSELRRRVAAAIAALGARLTSGPANGLVEVLRRLAAHRRRRNGADR